ncbi:phage portal protein [Halobacillus salinarum]|uniref:Phage portal protein n=1 Tax=Halobacillus salinarum TaxID=2932257 RepID=A0ABY4EH25_9BACI|nr:phage portal protein [Halobacillus salinarum]UOQ43362.1 phage portal protein [Halobacillus salinarum]
MAKTHAYVLDDGEVVSQKYMDRYAIKQDSDGGSKKIPSDRFKTAYGEYGLIQPLYNPEALAELLEMNTHHYRSVKTKARDIAGLGWYLEAADEVENPSEEQRKVANDFLKNPNPLLTLSEINDQVMVDFEATGDGYHEVIRNKDQELVGIEHIPSHTMRRHKDMDRYVQIRGSERVWFKRFGLEQDVHYQTGEYFKLGELDESERANEVLHIRNYTSRSDYYGIPDIMPALGAVLGDRERQEYNISFFDNHAIPAYAVTVSGAELDEDTEKQIQKFFQQDVKKSNHSTLVLTAKKAEGDMSEEPIEFNFQALSTDTKEASFRMFRQDNRDEVLSAHGVPPYRAGITVEGQLGGSSASEATEIYKQSIVKPKQELLENRINRFLLQEGLGVTDWVFRFKQIDTRDVDKEINRLDKLFSMGAYSPNMVLMDMGKEPLEDPNMDRHFVNGRPLDASNEEVQAIMRSMKDLHEKLIKTATKG